MLKATLASNQVLASITSKDPGLATSAKAFVAEIEQVAPSNVSSAWQVIGPVVLGVVKSGVSTGSSVDSAATLQAGQTIATDAKTSCNLDLTKVLTGSVTK